jgi:2-polyprenyl-3-methyl-5-hydroxy-6-metoxy-1,4-benzoquinol methylase
MPFPNAELHWISITSKLSAGSLVVTDVEYYKHVRYDVLAHVPETAKRVLSIGCGEGWTEKQLVERGISVTAVELNPDAARLAAQAGIHVICGDAHETDLASAGGLFDCLIYADVLEHIIDPESVLRRHVALLADNATVIVSVPNFRYCDVFWHLFVLGHVRYGDSGLFDRTHLRITTRRMVEEWFTSVGVAVKKIDLRVARFRDRLLTLLTLGLFREFFAYQVIVVGKVSGIHSEDGRSSAL